MAFIEPDNKKTEPEKNESDEIKNAAFFPAISIQNCREIMRLDTTITTPRLKAALIEAMSLVNSELAAYQKTHQQNGTKTLSEVETERIDGTSVLVQKYTRAVYFYAAADVQEAMKNYDATGKNGNTDALKRGEALSADYRRDGYWAICDILKKPRVTVDLI